MLFAFMSGFTPARAPKLVDCKPQWITRHMRINLVNGFSFAGAGEYMVQTMYQSL